MTQWSDARVEALKRGFYAGQSFAWIARHLGEGISRSACIGKATRLGLVRSGDKRAFHQIASKVGTANRKPGGPSFGELKAPPVVRSTAQNNGLNFGGPQGSRMTREGLRALLAFEVSGQEVGADSRVRLADVERHHCRWPFGDPEQRDFRFCGAQRARGAYCESHAAIAFAPPLEMEPLERLLGRLA